MMKRVRLVYLCVYVRCSPSWKKLSRDWQAGRQTDRSCHLVQFLSLLIFCGCLWMILVLFHLPQASRWCAPVTVDFWCVLWLVFLLPQKYFWLSIALPLGILSWEEKLHYITQDIRWHHSVGTQSCHKCDLLTFGTYCLSFSLICNGNPANLRPVWLSKQLSSNTKLRIFNTNAKTVLTVLLWNSLCVNRQAHRCTSQYMPGFFSWDGCG